MGCGETCPVFPGKRYEDWTIDDPKGQNLDTARRIIDQIDARVRGLLTELDIPLTDTPGARAMSNTDPPRVVFVCVKNGGKSQIAAGLMRKATGDTVDVDSAGTHPGTAINALSAQSLLEVGVDITGQTPKQLTPQMVAAADLVVTLGTEAHVEPVGDTPVVTWELDEPSDRGIEGIERMRLVRDDIARRVDTLADELNTNNDA